MNPWIWALLFYAIAMTSLFFVAMAGVAHEVDRNIRLVTNPDERTKPRPPPSGARSISIPNQRGVARDGIR